MGNPHFHTSYAPGNNESELYRNAVDEICEQRGIDFKYVQRTLVNPDYLFGEDTVSVFGAHETVTMWIENYEQFDGVGDLFSKFGFEVDNRLILVVATSRFDGIVGQEPQVDDLVYHPPSGKIFVVKLINYDDNMFQMNGYRDRYRLTCELFTPSHETYDTNVDDIDELMSVDDVNNDLEKDRVEEEIEDALDLDEGDIFGNI